VSAFAAVMTGRGSGAIATIQFVGDTAAVVTTLFRQGGDRPLELAPGRILVGHVVDGDEIVDQVTLGCEEPGIFALNCHGNPLIVERIVGLLERRGVTLLSAEQLLARILAGQASPNAIAAEAKLALATVKTITGAEVLTHQIESGLSATIGRWQQELGAMPLEEIAAEAERILRDSEMAQLFISGCTIALIGPPNTGKSTLLNTLAGREKAVVTDIRGTTRDWVSAEVHLPPLAVTVIDTAGLDPSLAATAEIDKAAQEGSLEIIARADLILLVLDLNQPADQLSPSLVAELAGRKTVVVLNKADLPRSFDPASLSAHLGQPIHISAKQGTGIEELIQAVHQTLGITAFNPKTAIAFTPRQTSLLENLIRAIHGLCGLREFDRLAPVAFTDRQYKRLEQLQRAGSVSEAAGIIEELIGGPLAV
jgi:tRNA modification GTPase